VAIFGRAFPIHPWISKAPIAAAVAVSTQSGVSRLARSVEPEQAELDRRRGWVLNERKRIQDLNVEIARHTQELRDRTTAAATATGQKPKRASATNAAISSAGESGQITAVVERLAEGLRRKKLNDRAEAAVALMQQQALELAALIEARNADEVRMLQEEAAIAEFLDEEAAIAALMTVM
jgi:hypothetical protein